METEEAALPPWHAAATTVAGSAGCQMPGRKSDATRVAPAELDEEKFPKGADDRMTGLQRKCMTQNPKRGRSQRRRERNTARTRKACSFRREFAVPRQHDNTSSLPLFFERLNAEMLGASDPPRTGGSHGFGLFAVCCPKNGQRSVGR